MPVRALPNKHAVHTFPCMIYNDQVLLPKPDCSKSFAAIYCSENGGKPGNWNGNSDNYA